MDIKSIVALGNKFLPSNVVKGSLAIVGTVTLVKQFAARLLSRGLSSSTNAADFVSKKLLASPLRPLILWQAPAFVSSLDAITAALVQIATTFKNELEKDIQTAAKS